MPPRESIRAMFGAVSKRYDFLNHFLSLHIDRLWRRRAVKRAQANGKQILDVCCGTGDLAFAFAKAGAHVTASDFTPEMVALAQAKKARRKGHATPRFLLADTLSLPFADNRFDVVSVAFGIRNVEDIDRGLGEMARVTRSGGQVMVLEFSKPPGRIFGPLYLMYFRHLLPRVGAILSRRSKGAYTYLPESVMGFPDPDVLGRHFARNGLVDVHYERLTRGVATLHIGKKA